MPDVCASFHNITEHPMATYGSKAGEKVEKAMHERKHGTLKSGGSGKKVTSRKQAIAIGLSEAREAGGKVPAKKAAAKKTPAKKTPAKKATEKKAPAKKR
jgi:topoisomerase IA-like protein